jgi:hypothetical protein
LGDELHFDLAGEEVGDEGEEGLQHLEGGFFIAKGRLGGDVKVALIFRVAGFRVRFGVGVVAGVAFEPHFDEDAEEFFGVFREGEGFDWV